MMERPAYEAVTLYEPREDRDSGFYIEIFSRPHIVSGSVEVGHAGDRLPHVGQEVDLGDRKMLEVVYVKHYAVTEWWKYTDVPPLVVLREKR